MSSKAYLRLSCKLSESELAVRSQELAREVAHHADLEEHKKESVKELGEQIKASDKKISELARVLRTGTETREVPITVRKVFGVRNVVETWRTDTGELVSERPMEPHERQADLYAGPGDDEDDDDDDQDDGAAATGH